MAAAYFKVVRLYHVRPLCYQIHSGDAGFAHLAGVLRKVIAQVFRGRTAVSAASR